MFDNLALAAFEEPKPATGWLLLLGTVVLAWHFRRVRRLQSLIHPFHTTVDSVPSHPIRVYLSELTYADLSRYLLILACSSYEFC